MRKIFIVALFSIVTSISYSQVFNTASTLKKGDFSLGLNPVFSSNDFGLFVHGGYGLKSGFDLAVKVGFGGAENYLGADLEWILPGNKPHFSIAVGGHIQNDFGLDGTFNATFSLVDNVSIYSGADLDINFSDDGSMPLWIPVGIEVALKDKLALILEGNIGLLGDAQSLFGGGLSFYF